MTWRRKRLVFGSFALVVAFGAVVIMRLPSVRHDDAVASAKPPEAVTIPANTQRPNQGPKSSNPQRHAEALADHDAPGSDPPTPNDLLTDFLVSGDRAALLRARARFPGDRLILLQCALVADQPDSPELDQLEKVDPENPLPHLIRASLHAENGDLTRFREELRLGISKNKLVTGYRQRLALIMDRAIAEGWRDLDPEVYTGFDKGLAERFEHAARVLVENPRLFGDEYESAGYAVAFAEKLRAIGAGRHAFGLTAGQLEIDVLQRLDPGDEYVDGGRTIGQYLAEMERRVPGLHKRVEDYLDPLMSPKGDPAKRLQFFARVRSESEVDALGWLIRTVDAER